MEDIQWRTSLFSIARSVHVMDGREDEDEAEEVRDGAKPLGLTDKLGIGVLGGFWGSGRERSGEEVKWRAKSSGSGESGSLLDLRPKWKMKGSTGRDVVGQDKCLGAGQAGPWHRRDRFSKKQESTNL